MCVLLHQWNSVLVGLGLLQRIVLRRFLCLLRAEQRQLHRELAVLLG